MADNRRIKIEIDKNIIEMGIDLSIPRLIPIKGTDNKGKEVLWHLKVTKNGKLVLL
jgi:hypothetical protein